MLLRIQLICLAMLLNGLIAGCGDPKSDSAPKAEKPETPPTKTTKPTDENAVAKTTLYLAGMNKKLKIY